MDSEIIVRFGPLVAAVSTMRSIANGTSYGKKDANLFLMSKSETADALSQAFFTLQEIEEALLLLINNTCSVMEAAGVHFEETDQEMAARIRRSMGPKIPVPPAAE